MCIKKAEGKYLPNIKDNIVRPCSYEWIVGFFFVLLHFSKYTFIISTIRKF